MLDICVCRCSFGTVPKLVGSLLVLELRVASEVANSKVPEQSLLPDVSLLSMLSFVIPHAYIVTSSLICMHAKGVLWCFEGWSARRPFQGANGTSERTGVPNSRSNLGCAGPQVACQS